MPDRVSKQEQDLIEGAVERGEVRVVKPSSRRLRPPLTPERFDAILEGRFDKPQSSGVIDRKPSRRVLGTMSVQDALVWAFRDEAAQLELTPPEDGEVGFGFGLEYVMIQRAKLGVTIDHEVKATNDPHEDAEAIAAIVSNLSDLVGGERMAIRVSEHARAAKVPEWMPDAEPRLEPKDWVWKRGRNMGQSEVIGHCYVHDGKRNQRKDITYTPCKWVPEPSLIASLRRDYREWAFALREIRRNLIAFNGLRQVSVTDDLPPLEPWST